MAGIKPSEVVDYRGLETYTNLIQQQIYKANEESVDSFTETMEALYQKVNAVFGATSGVYDMAQIKQNIVNAIKSKGVDVDDSLISNWDYLRDMIMKIPTDYFVMPRNPNNDRYPLPKPYISWSDNVSEAYDYAMQIQDTIINEGGIQSLIYPDLKYKGFYVVEYSLDAISYNSDYQQWQFGVQKRTDSSLYADAYLLNINYESEGTGFVEWTSEEKEDPNFGTKYFRFQLSELPQNGKLFMVALFENDDYRALIRPSGTGKVILIGGHPTYINFPSDARFDEGIIQLNKTGEPASADIPTPCEESDSSVYVLVNDYNNSENGKNLTLSCKYYSTDDPSEGGTQIQEPLVYDASTRYWYYSFDASYGTVTSISDVSIFDDGYGNGINNTKRYFYINVPKKTYPIEIDTDGFVISPDELATGTDYYINYPIANQIYLRQFSGAFDFVTNDGHSYVDKIHLPELNEHGYKADGELTESTWIINSTNNNNNNVFELELPNFEYLHSGGIARNMSKLHALVLPKLSIAKGGLAYNCSGLFLIDAPLLESTTTYLADSCIRLVNVNVPNLKSAVGTILNNGAFVNLEFQSLEEYTSHDSSNGTMIYGPYMDTVTYYHDITFTDRGYSNCYMYRTDASSMTVNFLGNNAYSGTSGFGIMKSSPNCVTFTSENQSYINCNTNGAFYSAASLTEVYMPSVTEIVGTGKLFGSCPNMKKLTLGSISSMTTVDFCDASALIYVKIGTNTLSDLYFGNWNPTLALSTSDNTLIDIGVTTGDTTTNLRSNLYRFLYNFRANIINNLYDYSEGATHYITINATTKTALFNSEAAQEYIFPGDTDVYGTALTNKLTELNWIII